MSKQESQPPTDAPAARAIADFAGGRAALTEANRHTDILYTSLAGVAAIVVVLLGGLSLPVFGRAAITSPIIVFIMALTALAGMCELCFINFRAHRHVMGQARLTEVLLNSLGQGFLSFDSRGICGSVYSLACIDLLEAPPAGRDITDVLRLKDEAKSDFKDWTDMLFAPNHALSFEDVIKFFPQSFAHSRGRHVALMYRPVRDQDGKLLSIVLIATDQTEEAESQLRARMQQNFVNMICRIFKERNQFLVTLTHLRKFVDESKLPVRRGEESSILRLLHTLKAAAKHFYLEALGDVIRKLEIDLRSPNLVAEALFRERLVRGGEEISACVKAVMEQVGDLIGQDYEGHGNLHELDEKDIYDFARLMRDRNVSADVVHDYLLSIAAVPIQECFRQFEREIKDLAEIMGKKVKPVHFSGGNPRVLAQPLQALMLSMMHICRNIVDHGIEPVVTRLARGKEPAGLVTIHASLLDVPDRRQKFLQILISDDGNGIDVALLRAKLADTDPQGNWTHESNAAILQRVLLWGVSTKNEINDVSGRGVGMEAVDREVRLLGGSIMVYSELYKGTCFDIRIPYHLEIPPG